MTQDQFSAGDPHGDGIRAAEGFASTVRSPRARRPVVVIGVALLGLAGLTLLVAAVLSH